MSPQRSCLSVLFLLILVAFVPFSGIASAAPPADEAKAILRDLHGDALPSGAIARLGTTRLRPGSPNVSIAFSPDSKILATGEEKLRFWEVSTGKEIRAVAFPDYVYRVRSITFSPDGKLFAANGDNLFPISRPPWDQTTIYVGEVGTGKILHRLKEDEVGYEGVQFSADGKLLVAQQDRSFQLVIWNVTTGKEVRRIRNRVSWSLSPDGKTLAVGQKDGVISLYELAAEREPKQFRAYRNAVSAVAFSPHGKTLASVGGQHLSAEESKDKDIDRTIRLWDVATGKETGQIKGQQTDVHTLLFTPDGQGILSVEALFILWEKDGGMSVLPNAATIASLWDTTTGKRLQTFPEGVFAFSPDGKHLLRSASDGLHEWDLVANKESRRWGDPSHNLCPASILYSPDGKRLASEGEVLHLWDVSTRKELHGIPGHRTSVRSLLFAPDGKRLVSIEDNRVLYLWETATGKPLATNPGGSKAGIIRHAFAQDGTTLMAVAQDGLVHVWDSATGKLLRSIRVGVETAVPDKERDERRISWLSGNPGLEGSPEQNLAFSVDTKTLVVAGADHVLHLWDVTTGKERQQLKGPGGPITTLRFAPDGKTLVARYDWKTTCLWDVVTGSEIHRFAGTPLAYSPDSRLIVWDTDKNLVLWDLIQRKELRRWPSVRTLSTSVAFSGDSKTVAAGNDAWVRLWDSATGREIRQIEENRNDFVALSTTPDLLTTPDGHILATYSMDRKHSSKGVMDVATGRRIDILRPYSGEHLAFAPDGVTFAKGTRTIKVRSLATGKTIWESPEAHRGKMNALVYSPDGKLLASASEDSTILIWDVSGFTRERFPDALTFTPKELDDLWSKLLPREGWDDRNAHHALLGTPQQTVPFLRERLRSLPVVDPKQLAAWIADLESDEFAKRKKAREELVKWGKLAAPALRKALADKPSPELKKSAEELLAPDGGCGKLAPEWQRAAEAVRLLEQMNTPESRKVLEELARISPGSWLAEETRAALDRPVKFRELKKEEIERPEPRPDLPPLPPGIPTRPALPPSNE